MNRIVIQTALIFSSIFFSFSIAVADSESELSLRLQHFKNYPIQHMQTLPPKSISGDLQNASNPVFSENAVSTLEYIQDKDKLRQGFCRTNELGIKSCLKDIIGRAGIAQNDNPADLVDNSSEIIRSIKEMDKLNLESAELTKSPWSDSYWPIYQGILAARYSHPDIPRKGTFKDFLDFFNSLPTTSFLSSSNSINTLSPAEKYDLLAGNTKAALAETMWAQGRGYASRNNGDVETWMGICHGWAPASYMVPRPSTAITVPTVVNVAGNEKQVDITFYPSDIKALSSYLWAHSNIENRFVGGRCNIKNPIKDNETGRITDKKCFDTNPGTWHITIVNQIGISNRSFVMDATYDYEVWNQPVYAYKYIFFNPENLVLSSTLAKSIINIQDFKNDKFKSYRDSKTKYLVGVSMTVTYISETKPTDSKTDGPKNDIQVEVIYEYDLELDENYQIIGGEWYTNAHPDFLWTPAPDFRATSIHDGELQGSWDAQTILTPEWRSTLNRASQRGDVLAKIVESLVHASQK